MFLKRLVCLFKVKFKHTKKIFLEGSYYAASYLYPRESSELIADLSQLLQNYQLRFHYYEGTSGVQLKGCCDTSEVCPFSSDKLVTVGDRMWKQGSFSCPNGTQKVIFKNN